MTTAILDTIAAHRDVLKSTTLLLLTDRPISKINRDLTGQPKAPEIGGARRHAQSSGSIKAWTKRNPVPGGLIDVAQQLRAGGGTIDLSTRTRYLAERVIAPRLAKNELVATKLAELGIAGDAHETVAHHVAASLQKILQTKGQEGSGESETGTTPEDLQPDETETATPKTGTEFGERIAARNVAINAFGAAELDEYVDLLVQQVILPATKKAELQDAKKLRKRIEDAISRDDAAKALWGLSRLERLGIDGALFGTMVTQHAYRIAAPSAVQVAHAFTVHRAFDFYTLEIAKDDLEPTHAAAAMLDASYGSGIFATAITIDHCQLIENVMRPHLLDGPRKEWADRIQHRRWWEASDDDRDLAAKLARAFVMSLLTATDHPMKTQTNARVLPLYALIETGAHDTLNHQGAFTTPLNTEEGSVDLLARAVARIRRHAHGLDSFYDLVRERAEFLVETGNDDVATPEGFNATRLSSVEAVADWIRAQVLTTKPGDGHG